MTVEGGVNYDIISAKVFDANVLVHDLITTTDHPCCLDHALKKKK